MEYETSIQPGKRGMTGKHGNHCRGKKVERVEITCAHCGDKFEKTPSFIRQHPGVKFCSRKCSGLANRIDGSMVEMECDECGNKFTKRADHVTKNNYCSRNCSAAGCSKRSLEKIYGTSSIVAKWRDKDQIRLYMAAYRIANIDRLRELSIANQKKNMLSKRENGRKWARKNKLYLSLKRGARRTLAKRGDLTKQAWIALVDFANGACLCCGSKYKIEHDHIVPVSRGGEHSILNSQPLCKSCNSRKSDKFIDYRSKEFIDFAMRLSQQKNNNSVK